MIRQAGFTLTELLVGSSVGLIVTGAVVTVYIAVIRSSTDTLQAAQLDQQLRAVAAIMVNDIRRAGYWGADEPVGENPFTAAAADLHILDDGTCLLYSYDRNGDGGADSRDFLGFRARNGEVWMRYSGSTTAGACGNGHWQGVTDERTAVVDELRFTTTFGKCRNLTTSAVWYVTSPSATERPCDHTAAPGYQPPSAGDRLVETRQITIALSGHLRSDPGVSRALSASVRVRNDRLFEYVP